MQGRLPLTLLATVIAFGCSDSNDPITGPGGVTTAVRFDHEANHHLTPLTGTAEVPQRTTTATGHATFHIASDGQSLGYDLRVSNITNVFQGHIHLGPAGQNGGIVAWLYPSTAPVVGPLGAGRIDGLIAQGVITQANLVGALAGRPLSELIDALRSGGAYVNVHTNDGVAPADTGPGDFPGGEIRGQIR